MELTYDREPCPSCGLADGVSHTGDLDPKTEAVRHFYNCLNCGYHHQRTSAGVNTWRDDAYQEFQREVDVYLKANPPIDTIIMRESLFNAIQSLGQAIDLASEHIPIEHIALEGRRTCCVLTMEQGLRATGMYIISLAVLRDLNYITEDSEDIYRPTKRLAKLTMQLELNRLMKGNH